MGAGSGGGYATSPSSGAAFRRNIDRLAKKYPLDQKGRFGKLPAAPTSKSFDLPTQPRRPTNSSTRCHLVDEFNLCLEGTVSWVALTMIREWSIGHHRSQAVQQ